MRSWLPFVRQARRKPRPARAGPPRLACSQGPISTAAPLEFGFSQPAYIIREAVYADVPWRQDVVEESFAIDPKNRTVTPNYGPGSGITANEAEIRKHPFLQEELRRVFLQDGSVGDWQMTQSVKPRALRPPSFRGRIGIARADFTPPLGICARNWGAAMHGVASDIHRPLTLTAMTCRSPRVLQFLPRHPSRLERNILD